MVGFSIFDGVDPIELFHEDQEGEFVLEGQRGQCPDETGFVSQFGRVAIGRTDEEGEFFDRSIQFKFIKFLHDLAGGEEMTSFIQGDAIG